MHSEMLPWIIATIMVIVTIIAAIVISYMSINRITKRCKNKVKMFQDEANAANAHAIDAEKKSTADILSFHSHVSHSMRVPISVIMGYSDLLKSGMVDEPDVQKEYFSKLYEKAAYLAEVLEQLFLESRTKLGTQALANEAFDLIALIKGIVTDMELCTESKRIKICIVSEEKKLMISGDVVKLTKAFYNILENAIKFLEQDGNINITLSKILNANDDAEAFIVFKDNGRGMEANEVEHIFDLNYQGSNKLAGNGFGLYLVRTIIEAHGGSVFAKSSIGTGMAIYIKIPI